MKKLTTLLCVAGLAMVPATSIAQESPPIAFDHGGLRYVYTVTTKGSSRFIEGVEATSGKRYSLTIRGTRVRGTVGGTPVEFKLSDVEPLRKPTTLASK